jgi:hypothetical protein
MCISRPVSEMLRGFSNIDDLTVYNCSGCSGGSGYEIVLKQRQIFKNVITKRKGQKRTLSAIACSSALAFQLVLRIET